MLATLFFRLIFSLTTQGGNIFLGNLSRHFEFCLAVNSSWKLRGASKTLEGHFGLRTAVTEVTNFAARSSSMEALNRFSLLASYKIPC